MQSTAARRSCLLALFLAVACSGPEDGESERSGGVGPERDVTFFGVGKVARYRQFADGSLQTLEPLFFAEIFIAAGGRVSEASVRFPPPAGGVRELGHERSASDAIGDAMYLSARAEDFAALEARFPSGTYSFSFTTAHGRVEEASVGFRGAAFPRPPVIVLEQDGRPVAVDAVDPEKPLVVTWTPFEQGRADENGILDDLIFVAIDSCVVEDLVHSGRPYERDDYLSFRDAEYVVPAGTLAPGQTWNMYVEHAVLPETRLAQDIPAFATLAASTYLDFRTAGEADPAYCGPE